MSGGKRKGAGRKALPIRYRRIICSFSLMPQTMRILEKLQKIKKCAKSIIVEMAIESAYLRENMIRENNF